MADTVAITAGSGTTISTDERTINSTAQHVQRVVPLGASSLVAAHVTVTNTATTIRAATDTQSSCTVANFQTVPVYIGPATVTTSVGFRLDPGAVWEGSFTCELQGITSAAYTAAGEDDRVHVLSGVSA